MSFWKKLDEVMTVIFCLVMLVAAVALLIWYIAEGRDYYPDQWFKKNIMAQESLSKREKEAVNKLYASAKVSVKESAFINNNYNFLRNLSPALKKYSRRSLKSLYDEVYSQAKVDIVQYPRFVRKDYFLSYSSKIEWVDWNVYDTGKPDGSGPSYEIRCNFSNLTNCSINRIKVKIYSERQDSLLVDGKKELRPLYLKYFTLFPAAQLQPEYYQQFICAVNYDDYSYIANNSCVGNILEVEIEAPPKP